MSDTANAVYLGLMLVIPLTALMARRLPLGRTVQMALIWLAIFAVLFLAVRGWQTMIGGHYDGGDIRFT